MPASVGRREPAGEAPQPSDAGTPELLRHPELVTRARTPVVAGHHRIAIFGMRDGSGITTITVNVGGVLARLRSDRVVAIETNPARGGLADHLGSRRGATARDLVARRGTVREHRDVQAVTSGDQLDVIPVGESAGPVDSATYRTLSELLSRIYAVSLIAARAGPALKAVLEDTDQVVVVCPLTVQGAHDLPTALDWLSSAQNPRLAASSVVALWTPSPWRDPAVDVAGLVGDLRARCRAVVRIPYDPALDQPGPADLTRLQAPTLDGFVELAAAVADGFTAPR